VVARPVGGITKPKQLSRGINEYDRLIEIKRSLNGNR